MEALRGSELLARCGGRAGRPGRNVDPRSCEIWNAATCSTYVACAAKQAFAFRGTHQRFTLRLQTLNKTATNSGILFIRYLALAVARDPPQ